MKVGRWSTTPGNNNAAPPDGWPEGQAPSTVNDCARENMAAIRTAFNDLQYFDQDFTPTVINATSFSVPGNQTSAIHAGRRLKLNDANVVYGTVGTASFTVVTTITVAVDNGATLTSSLSSFGLSVLSNDNNALPRNSNFSASAVNVQTLTASAIYAGSMALTGTLSVGNTAVAANFAKCWFRSALSGTQAVFQSNFNGGSISRSASGVFRLTFFNAMSDAFYTFNVQAYPQSSSSPPIGVVYDTITASSFKFRCYTTTTGAAVDPAYISGVFYR